MADTVSSTPINTSPVGVVILDPRITMDLQTRSVGDKNPITGEFNINPKDYLNLIVTISNLECGDFYSVWENLKANIASNITTITD